MSAFPSCPHGRIGLCLDCMATAEPSPNLTNPPIRTDVAFPREHPMPADPRPTGTGEPLQRGRYLVLSQSAAERHEPGEGEVCISITTPGQPQARLSDRFAAVLRMEFDDLDERHGAATISFGGPFEPFRPRHAKQALDFARAHADAPRIVVHCYMGVSRSRGVALGLLDAEGERQPDETGFNRHVRNTIGEVAEQLARTPGVR